MQEPVVSVLMPVYNAERFVREAVESILTQTFADLELIAVDDGSKDRSRAILEDCARHDSRMRVISRPNGGIGRTRNDALAAARGELIANLDADDVSEPDRLAIQVEYMQDHPECVILGSHVLDIDPDGDPIGPTQHQLHHEMIEAELLEGRGSAIWQSTSIMRRRDMLAVGGYVPEFSPAEDLDLYLKLAERGRLVNLPDVLVRMRRHSASATALRTQQEAMALRTKIVREAYARRGLDPADMRLRTFPQPASLAAWHASWAHTALRNGYRKTAVKHLARALRCDPFCSTGRRVLIDLVLGVRAGGVMRRWGRALVRHGSSEQALAGAAHGQG